MKETSNANCPTALPPEGEESRAYVVNVQRFTIHDGPGIRTELFLKGCPLRCQWCSNPETYERFPQVGVFPEKCIGCGYCLKACVAHGKNAIRTEGGKVVAIDRSVCDNCMLCEEECMSSALKIWGEQMTAAQAMDIIRRDREFYDRSDGGVTLSGGEALLQWQFCREVLRQCRAEGIHTCLESALHVPTASVEAVAPYIDLFITDIKQMDSAIHRQFTGAGNELILSNIRRVVELGIPLIIRMPIVPGFNDDPAYIDKASDFILNELENKPVQIQLLKYRPLGEEKAGTLGLPLQMKGMVIENHEEFETRIRGYVKRMTDRGIPAIAGSQEKKADA